jgi:hypothetical protein
MTRQRSKLTPAERARLLRHYRVYRNVGSRLAGQWVFQPIGFDSTFELYSDGYPTRRAATEAAWDCFTGPTAESDPA